MPSFAYLYSSLRKYLSGRGFHCPSCGGRESTVVDRKLLVTCLRRCENCRLLFRTPTTSEAENERIYQTAYTQGFTTELPDEAELEKLKSARFRGLEKDYQPVLEVLASLGGEQGHRVYDFGCSWGYGSWQLSQAGYQVDSYEISIPRRAYAVEKLGIRHVEPAAATPGSYDFFFSNHVLEHVPEVSKVVETGMRLLRPGGLFVGFTPNGGEEFQRADYGAFHKLWGFVHPQLLDTKFVQSAFQQLRYLVGTTPVDAAILKRFPVEAPIIVPAQGSELLLVVEKSR